MDSSVIFIAIIAIGLTATLGAAWTVLYRHARFDSWRRYAAARGLRFDAHGVGSGPYITGSREHAGRLDPIEVWLEIRPSGKSQVTYTFVEVAHPLHLPASLLVTRATAGTALTTFFGGQDLTLRDPEVDGDLRVQGEPEAAVRVALANLELRRAIHAFVMSHAGASVYGDCLRIERRRWLDGGAELDRLLDAMQATVTTFLQAGRFDPARAAAHHPRRRRTRRPATPAPAPAAEPAGTAPELPAPVGRLVADLAAGGRASQPGAFSLDRRAARDKLREYQLVTPGAWALELVQALIARSAAVVHVQADRDDLTISAAGRPFTSADLAAVWTPILADCTDDELRSRQRLAIGLSALLGQDPQHVEVWSGDEGGGQRLLLEPGTDERVEPGSGPVGFAGTRVTVKLGLLDAARNRNADALELVRARATHAAVPVTVNDEVVTTGWSPRLCLGTGEQAHDGIRVIGALDPTPGASARLRLQTDGVWIQEEEIPDATPGLLVVVECARFRKDLSQSRIVADALRERVDDLVTAAEEDLLARLVPALDAAARMPRNVVEAIRLVLRRRLLAYGDPAEFRPGGAARFLAEAPLYPVRRGDHACLATLLSRRDAGQPVPFADVLTPGDRTRDPATPVLDLDWLPDPAERSLLVHLLGPALVHVD